MVHVYCVGSHIYTTDCDITFSGISMHSFTVISSEENSAYFLQVQPITACTVTTVSFHRVPIGLSVQGQASIGWKRQPALLSMICGGTCWYWTSCSFWSATIFILMIVTGSWWQLCQGSDLAQIALLCCDMLWWNIAGVGFCGKIVWA